MAQGAPPKDIQQELSQQNLQITNLAKNLLKLVQNQQQDSQVTQYQKLGQQQMVMAPQEQMKFSLMPQKQALQPQQAPVTPIINNNTSIFNFKNLNVQEKHEQHETPGFQVQDNKAKRALVNL